MNEEMLPCFLFFCYCSRVAAGIELADLLGGFREKRALGLGSLFGDQHLTGKF